MDFEELLHTRLLRIREQDILVLDIISALLIFLITLLVVRYLKRILRIARQKNRINTGQEYAVHQLSKYLLYVIAIVLMLEVLHVRLSILLAGSAALLVGVGFGIQQLANDIISGFIILMGRSIHVDDIIEVDGIVARVQEIGIRTSQIETRDGIYMIIPNSMIISEKVINWTTAKSITRFRVKVGVAYGSDVELVKKLLIDCASKHPEIRKSPKPICRFVDFGNSSLDFELLFWSKYMFRIEDVKSDLRFLIDAAFRKHGIQIPFPQRDLHIRSVSEDFHRLASNATGAE